MNGNQGLTALRADVPHSDGNEVEIADSRDIVPRSRRPTDEQLAHPSEAEKFLAQLRDTSGQVLHTFSMASRVW
jgi:hypothetical protein